MKRYAFLVLAGLLAACGGHDEAVTPASDIAPEAEPASAPAPALPAVRPAKAKPVPAPDGQKGADLLEQAGVRLGFGHAVLYDILDTSASGTPRHRVLYEVQAMPFAQAIASMDTTLTALGYQLASSKESGGRIDQVYTAAGKPTYYLLMQPAGTGPGLKDPSATGSIHLMWNIPREE